MVCNGPITATAVFQAGFTIKDRSKFTSNTDGQWTLTNNAYTSFGLLQFGGTTAAFPAIKRNGVALAVRLADDSADASVSVASLIASATIKGGTYTVATLPSSSTSGANARAYVTDSSVTYTSANLGTIVAGGGSNKVPVISDGTNWYIG